jgi:SNF2-related domain
VSKTNLKVYVHHGPKREKDAYFIAKWDIVVTTYDTISSECWGRMKVGDRDDRAGGGVLNVHWWRVILGISSDSPLNN